jgi:putative ABC transport system substrate-binding protein
LANSDSEMQRFESTRPSQSVRLQRVTYEGPQKPRGTAFATFAIERPDALFISSGPFFTNRRVQLAQLATRYLIPAIHAARLYPEVGGLMSYGASRTEAHHQVGVYAGRILKGAKPADLPVVQTTKFELVINAHTARMLGLTVPQSLLSTADQLIE